MSVVVTGVDTVLIVTVLPVTERDALLPVGKFVVAKLPLVVFAVITPKFWPLGANPLMVLALSVPPRVTLPVTASTSYCVPAVVPPIFV